MTTQLRKAVSAAALASLVLGGMAQAATFQVTSRDAPGIGFNDPTPVAPVGGNSGTTLGQQRWNVYQAVAQIWGAALQSNVTITVSAGWEALQCDASSAVLGSASSWNGWRDFPNAPIANTWYPSALANKLAGVNIAELYGVPDDGTGYGNVDIKTQFNINLGQPNCLAGSTFYLGLDGKAPAGQVNFMATLLHELGHGLGFSLFTTSSANGSRFDNRPSVWEQHMFDSTVGKTWLQMTNTERVASAINTGKLAWAGANAVAGVPQTLGQGTAPQLLVGGSGAGTAAGVKAVGTASFGPALTTTGVSGNIGRVVDQANGTGLACTALNAANAAAVAGKIALVDRGTCSFNVKVKNAQIAGAIGVLVADNVVAAISGLGGTDPTVTIPSVRILKTDGDAIKAALQKRVRGTALPQVTARLYAPPTGLYAGADSSNRPLLYTPNPRQPGSSVSHWDTSAKPNLLMEPFISADLTTSLVPPQDLTLPLLKDLGW